MIILDNIIGLVTKTIYLTFRIYIIFIIVFLNIYNNYNSDKLLIISFIIYLTCLIVTSKISRDKVGKDKFAKWLIVFIVSLSVLLSVYLFKNMSLITHIIGIVYFIYLLYDCVKHSTEKEYADVELKNSLITLVISIILVSLFNITNNKALMILNKYLMIYFFTSFIYICRLNMKKEYESIYHETHNKSQNMFLFNIISMILIITLYFFKGLVYIAVSNIVSLIKMFFNLIIFFIEKAMDLIIEVLLIIAQNILSLFMRLPLRSQELTEMSETEPIFDNVEAYNNTCNIEKILKFIMIIVLLVVAIKLLNIIYKKIVGYIINQSKAIDTEEKEFIYDNENLLNNLKNRIIKMFGKLNKAKDLHYIRKNYLNCVNKLIIRGYTYKVSNTPNEYIKNITSNEIQELKFDEITNAYNDYRYGQKETH